MTNAHTVSELTRRLDPYLVRRIQEIVANNATLGSGGGGSGGAVIAHVLADDTVHTGQLDRSQALWVATDIDSAIAVHRAIADAHHDPVTLATPSGLTLADQQLAIADSVAGGGLTVASKVLAVGTPSTVSATSTNTVGADTHNHAADSSSNPGASAKLLESTSGGALTLEAFTSNGDIYGANTAFRVISHTHDYPHAHVVVNPGGSWNLDEQFGLDVDDNLLVRGWIVGKHALQIPGAKLIAHFDGMEPYELNYTGNAHAHMGQTPTESGTPIYRPGKFGKAIQVAEATTNLVTQPSFEGVDDTARLAGWSIFNDGSGDLDKFTDANASVYGQYSAKLTATAIDNSQFYSSFGSATSGQPYTASVWLKASVPMNVVLRIRQHTSPFTTWGNVTCAVTTEWQLFKLSVTAAATVTGRISIEPQAAGSVWVDGVQVENKSYATWYCDGSLGDGHSWSGTEFASSSSRVLSTLRYLAGNVDPVQGSVGFWFRLPYAAPNSDLPSFARLFEYGLFTSPVSATWLAMYTDEDHSELRFVYANGATSVTVTESSFDDYADGEWHYVTMTWEDGALAGYLDGALVSSSAITVTSTPTGQARIGVGCNYQATGNCPAIHIDDLLIVDRALAADEVRAIFESNAPVFAESSTWHWRSGQNRLWSDVEGLWMFNASGSAVLGAYAGDGAGGTKSWGGRTLGESDVLIGDEGRGGFLHWDDSAASLLVSGAIEISEASSFAGSGYLQVGAGTKDSTLDGWNFAAGEIVGQLNGVDQVVLSAADGSLSAAAGGLIINEDGMTLLVDYVDHSLKLVDSGDHFVGKVYGFNDLTSQLYIEAGETGKGGVLHLSAISSAFAPEITLDATDNSISLNAAKMTLAAAPPTLGTNWSNHSGRNLSARAVANLVELVGALDAGGSPSTTLATLSAAYRPTSTREMVILRISGGSSSARLVTVNTTGTIVATDWTPASGDVVYFQITYFL